MEDGMAERCIQSGAPNQYTQGSRRKIRRGERSLGIVQCMNSPWVLGSMFAGWAGPTGFGVSTGPATPGRRRRDVDLYSVCGYAACHA